MSPAEIKTQENESTQIIPPSQRINKRSIAVVIVLGIIFAVTLLYKNFVQLYKNLPGRTEQTNNSATSPSVSNEKISIQQWINCNDIRNIIEENNTLYVACLGGVLTINETSGKIIDQISMTQGLGNNVTYSLVKDRNILYVGTQDGFTIFNLTTRETKKISVTQGLISGANIVLALDGNDLWVGSFEGLSKYTIGNGTIQNFSKELADNSTRYNASRLLVTPKAIYAVVSSNSYTPGGIARWDKVSQKWERYGPPAFLETIDQYSRVDFFNLVRAGDKIYVASDRMVWEAEDKENTTWKRLTTIIPQIIPQGYGVGAMIGGSNLHILASNILFNYNVQSNSVKQVYPVHSEGEDIFASNAKQIIPGKEKLWINTTSGLKWLDLTTYKSGALTLDKKPSATDGILTVIDEHPIIYGDGQLWKYDKGSFKKILGLNESSIQNGGITGFQPIPNSQKIMVFSQFCGQGCSEPKLLIYDYKEDTIKPIEIPLNETKMPTQQTYGYAGFSYMGFNEKTEEFTFEYQDTKAHRVIFNSNTLSWRNESKENTPPTQPTNTEKKIACSPTYTFITNGNRFTSASCSEKLESFPYTWTIQAEYPIGKITQINKATNEKVYLKIPLAEKSYSPFAEQNNFGISNVIFADNKLWVATTRGLSAYDPKNQTWKLFTTKEGLVSNDVTNFAVTKNVIWATTNWGGLSSILY